MACIQDSDKDKLEWLKACQLPSELAEDRAATLLLNTLASAPTEIHSAATAAEAQELSMAATRKLQVAESQASVPMDPPPHMSACALEAISSNTHDVDTAFAKPAGIHRCPSANLAPLFMTFIRLYDGINSAFLQHQFPSQPWRPMTTMKIWQPGSRLLDHDWWLRLSSCFLL